VIRHPFVELVFASVGCSVLIVFGLAGYFCIVSDLVNWRQRVRLEHQEFLAMFRARHDLEDEILAGREAIIDRIVGHDGS
jgi:hypothetical protein